MPHAPRLASVLVLGTLFVGGCDIQDPFGQLERGKTLVNVSVTHHASMEAGVFPDRGGEGEDRTFDTDEGWTVTLISAFFTTADVTLHACEGGPVALDMYWGPLAEDLTARDLDLMTVGGVEVGADEFCAVDVHYGPFLGTSHDAGIDERVAGATFYLRGVAKKGDVILPFEVRSIETFDVTLDMSTIDQGRPLTVDGKEPFPIELALSKTYDRVFDGIDFETATEDEVAAQVGAVLVLESRISLE